MMFKIKNKKLVSLVVALMLIVAMALSQTVKAQDYSSTTNTKMSNFLLDNITKNFGINKEDLSPLVKAGMSYQEITNYLLELYPEPELKLTGEDFIRLANQTGITAIEAVTCYKLAYKWHKDPAWLAELYKETGDWDIIDTAFENFTKASTSQVSSVNMSRSASTSIDLAAEISREYNVDHYSVDTLVKAGATEEDMRAILFFYEIYANSVPTKEKSMYYYAGRHPIEFYVEETLQEGWLEELPEEIDYLRQTWPVREFPEELLPLEVPQDITKYAVQAQQTQVQPMGIHSTSFLEAMRSYISIVKKAEEVTPFNISFNGPAESVDPKTGNMSIIQQDFVLPGKYGTDFNFTRVFNGSTYIGEPRLTAVVDGFYVPRGRYQYGENMDSMGNYLDIYTFTYSEQITYDGYIYGTMEIESWDELIYDGGSIVGWEGYISTSHNGSYKFENIQIYPNLQYYHVESKTQSIHSNLFGLGDGWSISGIPTIDFIETYLPYEQPNQRQMYISISGGGTYKVNLKNSQYLERRGSQDIWVEYSAKTYHLVDINGGKWTFDLSGRPTKYTGKFGETMTFTYSGDKISRITDTVGRVIRFTHTGSSVIVDIYSSSNFTEKLETWIYDVASTSVSGTTKLTRVQRPSGPDISYSYAEVQTPYSEVFEDQTYTSMTTLINLISVSHPTGAVSNYIYDSEGKKLVERYDVVPTSVVTQNGISSDVKIENRMNFSYTDNSATRTSVRAVGEIGTVPAVEYWEYDSNKRIILHKITGTESGAERLSTEEVTTSYHYNTLAAARPTSITTTTILDGISKSSTSMYVWDTKGNITKETDSIGRYTTYTYNSTYNMLIERKTYINASEGVMTTYTLDSTKKKVTASKESYFGYGMVQSGTNNYPALVADVSTSNVDSYIWSPTEEITSVYLEIFWKTKGWGNGSKYYIDYKAKGSSTWVQCYNKTHDGGLISSSGTDKVSIDLPTTGYYDIRVRHSDGKELRIRAGYATGPRYIESSIHDSNFVYTTYEYSTSHPGNLTATNIYPLGVTTGTPESRVAIGYDSLWNAYPCETTKNVTSVDNVTTTIREYNEYDKLGKLLVAKTQELLGSQVLYESQVSYEYDLLGRVVKITNPPHDSNNTTSYSTISYNDNLRQITTTNELGSIYGSTEPATVTRQTYDGLGRAMYAEWKDEQGNWHLSSSVKYDSLGRQVSVFDAAFNETKYEYDSFGRVIKTLYADDNPVERSMSERWYVDVYQPSSLDASISTISPSGFDTLDFGGLSVHKDAEGNYSYSVYDILGRSVFVATNKKDYSSSTPVWDMTWYEYDKLNRVIKVAINRTATEWDVTEYEYSYNGHNTVSSSPLTMKLPGNVESKYVYEYNSRGLTTKEYQVNTPSKATTMDYDQIGRLIRITYPNELEYVNISDTGFVATTQNVTRKSEYYYNIYGMTKANSFKNNVLENSVLMNYNKRGWLMSETWVVNPLTNETYSFVFTYDASGNKLSMQYPDQSVINYHYDELHRLKSIPGFFENNGAAGFVYDNVGNLTDMYAINGIHTEYSYNQRNMVSDISSDPLSLSYVYDHTRNITSITDSSSNIAITLNYTYDARGQLKTADVRQDDGIYTVAYDYDGANNRISEIWSDEHNSVVSQTWFTYQSGSYLNNKSGTTGATSYTWNTVGQLSTKMDSGNTQVHLFGGMGHLTGVAKDGTILEVYTYDALGRRLKVVTNEEIILNFPLGNDSGYEDKRELSTGDISTTKYISVNGKYLAKTVQENGGTEQKYFHHVDMVGSIRAITDMSGQVTASYEYEPFGLVVTTDGMDDDNLGFAGKRLDGTGLSYFGGRYYDAGIGRFISRDPARSGRNWFVYCSNNPLIYIDPTGYMDSLEGWVKNPLGYVTDPDTGERINHLEDDATEAGYWDEVGNENLVNYILNELNSKNPNLFSNDDAAAFYFGNVYSILSHNFGFEIGAHGYYTSNGSFYLSGAYTSFITNRVNHPLDDNGFDSFGNKADFWFHTHTLGEGEVFSKSDLLEQVRSDITGYVVTPGGKLIKHSNKTHDIHILSESMPIHPKHVYDHNEYQDQLDYQNYWLDLYNRLFGVVE